MNAKLIVDGNEFDIEILDPKLQKLLSKSTIKTGYERVGCGKDYFYVDEKGEYGLYIEENEDFDKSLFLAANYYSSEDVAENNARADMLMRQLRRFAAENRECNSSVERYYIIYINGKLQVSREISICYFGPWFDNLDSATKAIEKFNDELIWYFTKYKDCA